jgi:hypothetical protein
MQKAENSNSLEMKKTEINISTKTNSSEEVEKIIMFYKNGTFKSYFPN